MVKSSVEIKELKYVADIHVVEDKVMSNQAIIGLNVLMQGETTINEMGITVKNKCLKEEEINLITVLLVDLTISENEINDPNVPNQIKKDVQYLVSNYEL